MKQRLSVHRTLPLLALAAIGFACGLTQERDAKWGQPAPPSDPGNSSGQYGSASSVNAYTDGTASDTPGNGSAGSGYTGGSSGYPSGSQPGNQSPNGSASPYYGGPPDQRSGNTETTYRTYGYSGGTSGTGLGSTGPDGETNPTDPELGYMVYAEFSRSFSGWFVCEYVNGIGAAGLGSAIVTTIFGGFLPKLIRWASYMLLGYASIDNLNCPVWLTGAVGGMTFNEPDVTQKRRLIKGPLDAGDLIGQRVVIDIVNTTQLGFRPDVTLAEVESSPSGTSLGRCQGTISERHLQENKMVLKCAYGDRSLDLNELGPDLAMEVQDRHDFRSQVAGANDSSAWGRFIDGLQNMSFETGQVTLNFQ
jgi:hypothetical protein